MRMAIGQGAAGVLMDDLLSSWLQNQLRGENRESSESMENTGETDPEDSNTTELRKLFKKSDPDNTDTVKKKTNGLIKMGNPEWIAMSVGIFFVTSLFTVASYQAYRGNILELSHVNIVKDDVVHNDPTEKSIYSDYRLPVDVSPISYILYLYPSMKEKTYRGLIKIDVICKRVTSRIVLHSSHHKVRRAVIKSKDLELVVTGQAKNRENEMLILSLSHNLTVNSTYQLFIGFHNELSFDINNGIYLTEYTDGSGMKRQMMSTDFEPRNARRAFPCFDEPAMKASWSIMVQHEGKSYHAISNMPVSRQVELNGGNIETTFENTPPMSTYLVVIALSEYKHVDTTSKSGKKIRVYYPTGREMETGLALTIAPLAIDFYTKVFGIEYALPKLGLMPVTRFSAGADETWGMMLFQERALLYNPHTSSAASMIPIASTITHEIAHQWFGDLVTMKWWNDLWLKESFASYLEYIPLRHFYPSWDLETSFYSNTVDPALLKDASVFTHPIATTAMKPKALMNSYDDITYLKGAAVIAMLGKFLGDDKFFKGTNIFLTKYHYESADISQFWEAMSEAAHPLDVVTFMDHWLTQPGFPLISIKRVNGTFRISQERYAHKKLHGSNHDNDSSLWHVPIPINICGNTTFYHLKTKEGIFVSTDNCTIDPVYKANYGASGFYRVNYDDSNWQRLLNLMNTDHTSLPPIDRASIFADVYSLVNFNQLNLTLALQFTEYLDKEHHPVPWSESIAIMNRIRQVFYHTKLKKCVEAYTLSKVSPVLEYLNSLKTHNHIQKNLIHQMLGYAVSYNLQPITTQIENLFLRWIVSNGTETLPTNTRYIVLTAGILHNGVYEWEYVFEQYEAAHSVAEQHDLLSVLSSTKDKKLLQRLVDYARNSNTTSDTSKVKILEYVCSNRHGRNISWNAVKEEWKELYAKYKDDSGELNFVLESCLGGRTTQAELDEAKEFMANATIGRYELLLKKITEENIPRNIEFKEHEKEITDWFTKHHPKCLE